MSFWTSETIKSRTPNEQIITPYHESHVKSSAYELSVGSEAFVTSETPGNKIQLELSANKLKIPPGQLGLLITDEVVKIPLDTLGFISIRAGIKFNGLINVSGFHVDPGYHGRLKFTVYNAGSRDIYISPGESIFLMWFCSLDQTTSLPYNGEHMGQMNITSNDIMKISGDIASPAALKDKLDALERELVKKHDQLERELENRHKDLKLDYEKRMHALETAWTLLRGTFITLIIATVLAFAGQLFTIFSKSPPSPTINVGTPANTSTSTPTNTPPPPALAPETDAGTP